MVQTYPESNPWIIPVFTWIKSQKNYNFKGVIEMWHPILFYRKPKK